MSDPEGDIPLDEEYDLYSPMMMRSQRVGTPIGG